MSAIHRFHEVANDALVTISEHLKPEAKLTLIIYTPGEPEQDILLKGPGVNADEVLNTLRRRGGLSLDGDNAYKRGVCDTAGGALASGKQNRNPPPEGHWGQRFWDIGRAEGEVQEQLVAALEHLVAVTTPDANDQFGAKEEHEASLAHARELIRLHRS